MAAPSKKARHAALTVSDILADDLTQVANAYWAPGSASLKPFDATLIEKLYAEELAPAGQKGDTARLMLLEFSCYLEKYVAD